MPATVSPRPGLILVTLACCVTAVAAEPIPGYSRADARQYILEDFCKFDCAGYLKTHSPRYRRTYARALDGNFRALHTVLLDPRFHSGDNETWEEVPGNLLYVVGDARFDRMLSTMPVPQQRFVMTYLQVAGFFHGASQRGERGFFAAHFPITHRRYARFYLQPARAHLDWVSLSMVGQWTPLPRTPTDGKRAACPAFPATGLFKWDAL